MHDFVKGNNCGAFCFCYCFFRHIDIEYDISYGYQKVYLLIKVPTKKESIDYEQPKRIIPIVLAIMMIVGTLSACGPSQPCESCGKTPTKGYLNEYSAEKEYYCSGCSSDCAFCSNKATNHYTSGLDMIVFACNDCYKEIQDLNS